MGNLALAENLPRPVSPFKELGAYEALWTNEKTSFKSLADIFRGNPGSRPSDFVEPDEAERTANEVYDRLGDSGEFFGVRLNGAAEYPHGLRDADHPVELLYYRGWWDLVFTAGVAVVGSRKPSSEGARRARKLAKMLAENDYTVVSGLAAGIDTVAHTSALESGGRTIAVIGTPLNESYPKTNKGLQDIIAREMLVVSQVPVLRYNSQDYRRNRFFFPERNKTMSALTKATVIVEASETSGTLIQARAALNQGRKLFILDNCFQNPAITWPEKYEKKGAIRVRDFDDIKRELSE